MPAGVLGRFKKPILQRVDWLFQDPQLVTTITYQLYRGRTEQGTQSSSFQIPAVRTKDVVRSEVIDQVQLQVSERLYIIRESDLPSGVTVASLNVNDRVTDSGGDFIVTEINKTLGFVIQLSVTGDR
jgi:hypothetical protein